MPDRVSIGNIDLKVYVDWAPPPFDPADFFDVPLHAWDPYKKDHLDSNGKFNTNFCAWLLRAPGQTILVDTGIGPDNGGQLLNLLINDGIKPEDIDTVVITHFHGDHLGWTVIRDDGLTKPTFPNARYIMPQRDWDYFTQPDVIKEEEIVLNTVVALNELSLVDLVGDEFSIIPEVTTLATPGHTPGHISLMIVSQGEHGVIVGDLFHGSVQVSEPEWCAIFDMDKPLARQTRNALFERLEQEEYTLCAGHLLAGNNIGKIVRMQGKRYWQSL